MTDGYRATFTVRVHDNGAYRWATVVASSGPVTVEESERVDKHYEPFLGDEVSKRAITPRTVEQAIVAATRAARRRASVHLVALLDSDVATPAPLL